MKQISILFALLWAFPFFLFAQKEPIKWGKISPADLKMTVYEEDPAADAVILGELGDLRIEFPSDNPVQVVDIHRQIKILTRQGFTYADVEIPFFAKGNFEKVDDLQAQVISPDGTITKVEKGDIFLEEVSENYSQFKFSFPNVEVGSVLEYRYKFIQESVSTLREWYFQSEIPCRVSEYRLRIPAFLNYVTLKQGRAMDVEEMNEMVQSMRISGWGNSYYQGKVRDYRYVQLKVPALKEESFITTMWDYYARISFQLQFVQFEGENVEPHLTNWQDLAERLMNIEEFGGRFERKGASKEVLNGLEPTIAGVEDPKEKARIIYAFVAEHFNWNGSYSFLADRTPETCFYAKEGNSGEINLALLALLKHHGITCYPVLISTREHGKMIPLYPIRDQFNHVVVLIDFGDSQMVADIPNRFRPMGFPVVTSLNRIGWLVDRENNQWVNLPTPGAEDVVMFTGDLKPDGSLNGNLAVIHKGYTAIHQCIYLNATAKNPWEELLLERFPGMIYQEKESTPASEAGYQYRLKADIEVQGFSQGDDQMLYCTAFPYKFFKEHPFTQPERTYPVELTYPLQEKLVFNLNIPDGYEVLEYPEDLVVALPNQGGFFKFKCSLNGNRLQVISDYQITQLVFEPEEYAGIKQYFDLLVQKQEEQIVLQKKS